MPIFNKEFWIWTELLAFDNEASDQGVDAYIQRVGKVPDGIALMLSHLDIIFLHPGIEKEGVLLPIYCSRRAHDRNAVRRRQDWTNFQLRELIQALQAKGVKVFLSTFSQSLNNQYHQEWRSQFLHAMLCDIDNDGHDIADYFAKKLRETVTDYGFDGWHGADGCMSGGWFMVGNYPIVRQKIFYKFI